MPDCPKCHQPVPSQALTCPHCHTTLKAHGHPGMPLYQAQAGQPLCLSCQYHEDDTCNFAKRPTAMDCTLYRDIHQPIGPAYQAPKSVKICLSRYLGWIAFGVLLLISFLLALLR